MKIPTDSWSLFVLLARSLGLPSGWLKTRAEKAIERHRSEGGKKAWETRRAKDKTDMNQ